MVHLSNGIPWSSLKQTTHFARAQSETARDQFFWKRSTFVASTASCNCRACERFPSSKLSQRENTAHRHQHSTLLYSLTAQPASTPSNKACYTYVTHKAYMRVFHRLAALTQTTTPTTILPPQPQPAPSLRAYKTRDAKCMRGASLAGCTMASPRTWWFCQGFGSVLR